MINFKIIGKTLKILLEFVGLHGATPPSNGGVIGSKLHNVKSERFPPLAAGLIGSKECCMLVRTFCPKPLFFSPLASINSIKTRQRRANKGCGLKVLTSRTCKLIEPITPAFKRENGSVQTKILGKKINTFPLAKQNLITPHIRRNWGVNNFRLNNITKTLLYLFFVLGTTTTFAQRNNNNNYTVVTLNFTYGAHSPAADLSNRFGNNFSIGGGLDLITEKKNFIFGLKGNNLFGNVVKEDVLSSLRDSDGFILGSVGAGQATYAEVFLRERGFYAGGHFGKLFPLSKKNKRAGIRLTLGAGLLQHKVRIQDETGAADQLAGELIKGYDQLSNGLSFEQFIGYQQLNRKTGINFFVGFEITEAFTKNRRAVNFNTQSRDNSSRFDVLLGFRVGWSFTFYVGERAEDIRY